jgi:hypothetical protein
MKMGCPISSHLFYLGLRLTGMPIAESQYLPMTFETAHFLFVFFNLLFLFIQGRMFFYK